MRPNIQHAHLRPGLTRAREPARFLSRRWHISLDLMTPLSRGCPYDRARPASTERAVDELLMESFDEPPEHRRDSMDVLGSLVACEQAGHGVTFDVAARCYVADVPNDLVGMAVISGPMTLVQYNDLKLIGYLREDDEHSTRIDRRFSLTPGGRTIAEGRSR